MRPMPASRISPLTPTVAGLICNASAGVGGVAGVTRSGGGTVTAPLFSAVTMVNCSPDASWWVVLKLAVLFVFVKLHGSVEPAAPSKHVAFWKEPAGIVTVAVTDCLATGQAPPSMFQYSSSWSAKAFMPPVALYLMT